MAIPSAELLRYLAAIGATLLIAHAVEASAAVRASRGRGAAEETWVGYFVGAAGGGLLGIALALGLAERAEVGHWTWLDELAFAISIGSILMLGLLIAGLPYLAYEWTRQSHLNDEDD